MRNNGHVLMDTFFFFVFELSSFLAQRVHVSEILRHFSQPLKACLWSNRNDFSYFI